MREINSSNLTAFEFIPEDEEQGTLRITFRSGRTYRYEGVTIEDGEALDRAADAGESVGSLFSRNIRPTYPGTEEI